MRLVAAWPFIMIAGISLMLGFIGGSAKERSIGHYKGFRPCQDVDGLALPPPPPLNIKPGDSDPRIGFVFQWQVNDKGEFLYRRLGKSNIKIEFVPGK